MKIFKPLITADLNELVPFLVDPRVIKLSNSFIVETEDSYIIYKINGDIIKKETNISYSDLFGIDFEKVLIYGYHLSAMDKLHMSEKNIIWDVSYKIMPTPILSDEKMKIEDEIKNDIIFSTI